MARTQTRKILRLRPWIMWLLGALFYCYEFFLQVSPSVMVHDLMRGFSVSAAQLGNLAAFYLYSYTCMQIPGGILLDHLGPRRLLTLATAFCAVGALVFGHTHTFAFAAGARFFIGLGSAFAVIGCLHIAATWLPTRYFAVLTGAMVTLGMLGAAGGQAPLSLMVHNMGWRHTMILLGAIGIILSIAMWSVVRDHEMPYSETIEKAKRLPLDGFFEVIRSKQTWLASIYGGLMFLPTPGFIGLWAVPFMMRFYDLTRPIAATVVSMTFIGWAVAGPLVGYISDKIGRRKPLMYIGSTGALILISIVLYVPGFSLFTAGTLYFLFGVFSAGFLPAFPIVREINKPEANATALGFINTLNMVGAAIIQPVIGWLLDVGWNGKMHHGARIFSVANYHHALLVIPICIGLALVICPFVRETYCKDI